GIGREIARAFVEEGAHVHVCDVDGEAIAALAKTDPAVSASLCDIADRAQVARLFETAVAKLDWLDVLVN
ncbi:SDR family oxidoreductase, partial [Klebsiella pneumoniae]|uniref:SDR family oxidoreductase n=1 Tax=Klebsiella pneumoniae TaxID=573 RepID=UPI0013D7462D